jgi:hypothetical protein
MRSCPSIERALIPFVLGAATLTVSFAACAPDSTLGGGSSFSTASTATGSQSAGSGQTGAGGQGGEPVFVGSSGAGDGGPDPDAACGLITEEAKGAPLDLYIAFDKSSSMKGTKWDSAKAGLSAFVADPTSAGVKVALNFFPLPNESTCDQFAYKEPVVPYAELPQNAQAITDAINAESPNGFSTPIYPALGGAILKGIEVTQNNPGDVSAVLLVTDGLPVGPAPMCGNVDPEDPQAIADLAAKGATMYNVRTFVIGLPGVDQAFANKVAAAGGTDAAILVSAANVQAEFQAALAKVRGEALPCEYDIPTKVSGGEVDPGFVNILLSLGGQMAQILPQDPSCAGEGWTYDDPANPTKILFCDTSCKAVKADYKAKVQILLGCKTEIAK